MYRVNLIYAPLAQLVEQLTLNQWVLGSSPRWCTTKYLARSCGVFFIAVFRKAGAWCTIGDENSPGPASAYRGAKTVLRTVFRARESPRFNGSMMGMRVEKRVVDPYSIRYYKTAGVFSACRLLFIGEIFSIAFYKELRLNKLEFVITFHTYWHSLQSLYLLFLIVP